MTSKNILIFYIFSGLTIAILFIIRKYKKENLDFLNHDLEELEREKLEKDELEIEKLKKNNIQKKEIEKEVQFKIGDDIKVINPIVTSCGQNHHFINHVSKGEIGYIASILPNKDMLITFRPRGINITK